MARVPDVCDGDLSEVSFFEPITRQSVLKEAKYIDYHPINAIGTSTEPIEFIISGSANEFIDLNSTTLEIDVKLQNSNGKPLDTTKDALVAPANTFLSAMFADCIVQFGDTVVQGGNSHYPYSAYFTQLLLYNKGAKKTHLQSGMWYKDLAGKMDEGAENTTGFAVRAKLAAGSSTMNLVGTPCTDVTLQNKYLINNLDVKFKFTRAKPTFCTMIKTASSVEDAATAVNVVITRAVLYVRKVTAEPSMIQATELSLVNQNAIIPVQRTEMLSYTIPSGVLSNVKDDLYRNELPKFILVGLVSNEAYNGSYGTNPFNFDNFKVNRVGLYKDGEPIPHKPLTPDFENKIYMKAYLQFMDAIEMQNRSEDNDITWEDYPNGYCLYGFNLTPDNCIAGHAQVPRTGNLRLELNFEKATKDVLNCIVMAIFDGKIEITSQRKVYPSWK